MSWYYSVFPLDRPPLEFIFEADRSKDREGQRTYVNCKRLKF